MDEPPSEHRSYGSTPVPSDPSTEQGPWYRPSTQTKGDAWEIVKLSLTIVAVNFASNIVSPISIMFIGQIGVIELDGVNLASLLINVSTFAVSGGMTTACDTLIGQAFGSNNKEKVGIYLQQGLVIIMLFVLPIWALHLNAENLLLLMGQDPAVCRIAGEYLTMTLPAMFFMVLYRIIASYLRSIGHLSIPLTAGCVGTVVNIAFHYALVVAYPMGITGSAIAQDCAYFSMASVTIGLMFARGVYKDTWNGWTVQFLQNWGLFLKIGLAGFGIWFTEFIGLEIGAIQAGLLGTTELGAQSIVFQIYLMAYSIPLGFGIGCNIRVAQLLGAGDVERTKLNCKIVAAINAAAVLLFIIIALPLRGELPKIFSSDPDVITYTSNIIPFFCLHFLLDGLMAVYCGILRGCGLQLVGVAIYINAYFVIALPLSIVLMFVVDIGVSGFWIGTTTGMFTTNVLATIYTLCKLDWEREAKIAQHNAGPLEDDSNGMNKNHREGVGQSPLQTSRAYEYEEDTAETMGLLTYKDIAKRATEMRWKDFYIANIKAFSGGPRYPVDMEELVPRVQKQQPVGLSVLLWRRGLFVAFMFLVLVVAVLTRVFIPAPDFTGKTDLCLPWNTTVVNSSLPFCNYSSPIFNVTDI